MRPFDPDQLLIEEMLRPPPLEQARNSLQFWSQRRTTLPFYRRAARREADEMVRRSYAQVEAAVRRRYGTGLRGLVRRLLAGEPIPWALGVKPLLVSYALRIVPRRFVIAAAATAAAACLLLSGVAVALVVLVIHAV